ncbi:hypothetical protein [Streptomyces californicus]|uniref:hypothetical protein n=1 Tax=Streptomyces californicus TaxID=67351 RepID=UPI0004C028F0|nr:hypothetical protein [Streptomyces californicus]QRV53500.1 hypothetical protein I6J40_04270 [Streptomyces californicus]
MAPEIVIAVITAASVLGAAVVAAVPALLTVLRRTRVAVENQGEETRAVTLDALDAVGSRLQARFDARLDDVRDDLDEVRESVARVREWQAGHDAEHLLIPNPRPGGDA